MYKSQKACGKWAAMPVYRCGGSSRVCGDCCLLAGVTGPARTADFIVLVASQSLMVLAYLVASRGD